MAEGSHVGRPSSWVAVGVMLVGFVIGGIALVLGPTWVLFWVGVAIVAVGGVFGLSVGIFTDVVTYEPRDVAAAVADGSAESADAVETQAVKTEPAEATEDASHGR